MHIYDFITDEIQYKLKSSSRLTNQKNAFEFVLETYQYLFLQEFDKLTSTEDSNYLSKKLKDNEGLKNWFIEFLKILKNDRDSIITYLNELIEVYKVFIRGKHQTSIMLLHYMLEKYELLDNVNIDLLGSYFRGRKIEQNDAYLEDSFYYHIPFNERYKIKNQRFSFTGIPLHYAGASMLSTMFELRSNGLDDKSFGLSMFYFDPFATSYIHQSGENVKPKTRIYDISNSLYEVINDLFYTFIEDGITVDSSLLNKTTPGSISREFKKFILSQLCTFPKNNDTFFVEEYVLPQLLTESIRIHKYDGIIYTSTLLQDKKINTGSEWNSSIYKNNIVMFSDYSYTLTHDPDLYANLKTKLLNLTDVNSFSSISKLSELSEAVVSLQYWLHKYVANSPTKSVINSMLRNVEKKLKLYKKLTVDSKSYLTYFAGKVELKYLHAYFTIIRNRVYEIYPKEVLVSFQNSQPS